MDTCKQNMAVTTPHAEHQLKLAKNKLLKYRTSTIHRVAMI